MLIEFLHGFDLQMFNLINAYAGREIFFNDGLIFYAQYYPFIIFFLAIAYVYNGYKDRRITERFIYQTLFAMILCGAFKYLITLLYFRNRPFINNPTQLLLDAYPLSSSFPSGHALISFAIVATTYFYHKKLCFVLGILAFIGGILRIFGGVHYPLDIVAGITGGILSAMVIKRIMQNEKVKEDLEEIMI